jgi:hypothetical protein
VHDYDNHIIIESMKFNNLLFLKTFYHFLSFLDKWCDLFVVHLLKFKVTLECGNFLEFTWVWNVAWNYHVMVSAWLNVS